MCLFAAAAPAGAQAPALDPFEPNDSAQIATPIEPRAQNVATIGASADADWYTFGAQAPAWEKFFASGDQVIAITAARLGDGCAERSLRVTAYTAAGVLVTSASVFPGSEATVLELHAERGTRYDLLVDTGLDPACAGPVPYAIRAEPYTPPPPPPTTARAPNYNDNATKCAIYRDKRTQLTRRIKDAKKRHLAKKLITKLNKELTKTKKGVKGFCKK